MDARNNEAGIVTERPDIIVTEDDSAELLDGFPNQLPIIPMDLT